MTLERQLFNARNGVTAGVWREGDVIVKRLQREAEEVEPFWAPSTDPRHWNYWRREALAYATDLPGRLGLLGREPVSIDETDAGIELRMPAFAGRSASDLEFTDLEELATVLGMAQGRDDLPSDDWLSRGFLRSYSRGRRGTDHASLGDDELWSAAGEDPDGPLRTALLELHANRERLLAISEALPRTVCHLDLFPSNVFATRAGIGIIDWSFSGDGALGEDIGNLVPDSVFDLQVSVTELEALEERLSAAYIAGLRIAGWTGDDRLVMLAIHASAIKYDWLGPRVLAQAAAVGDRTAESAALDAARFAGLALCGRWAREALVEAERLRV